MTETFDEELDVLLGRTKGKAANDGKVGGGSGKRPRRYLAGAPEVMVKITGWGHSLAGNGVGGKSMRSIAAHVKYITRKNTLDVETSEGIVTNDKDAIEEHLTRLFGDTTNKPGSKQRESLHLVLSMPAGTEPEAVRSGARTFLRNRFGDNHAFFFVLHTDTDNPHVHAVVKNRGYDGRKLHYEKGELQTMRQEFADAMNAQGVFADATPRSIRGVVEKSAIQSWLHMLKGDEKRAPRMPKKLAMQIADAVKNPDRPKPWLDAIQAKQAEIRDGLRAEIAALRELGTPSSMRKAGIISAFLDRMPPVRTQDDRLRDAASQRAEDSDQPQLF